MESQKIKEDRRRKFLDKMGNRNKTNKGEKNKTNNNLSKPQNEINFHQKNKNNNVQTQLFNAVTNPENFKLDKNSNLLKQNQGKTILNNIFNKDNKNEIDFKNIIEQMDKYDYMINFQNIIKKILIIILSLIHCLKYSPLYNIFVFKYTFIILELSSAFFNKYYYSKKADLRKKMINSNTNIDSQNQVEKIIHFLLNNCGFLNQVFVVFKALKDIFSDISILIIINVIYFIFKESN